MAIRNCSFNGKIISNNTRTRVSGIIGYARFTNVQSPVLENNYNIGYMKGNYAYGLYCVASSTAIPVLTIHNSYYDGIVEPLTTFNMFYSISYLGAVTSTVITNTFSTSRQYIGSGIWQGTVLDNILDLPTNKIFDILDDKVYCLTETSPMFPFEYSLIRNLPYAPIAFIDDSNIKIANYNSSQVTKSNDLVNHIGSSITSELGIHNFRHNGSLFQAKSNEGYWQNLPFETGSVVWGNEAPTPAIVYNTEWVNRREGSGTQLDPYLIYTPYDLDLTRNDLNANYKLMNNIDLTSVIGLGVSPSYSGWLPANDDPLAPCYNAGKGWESIAGAGVNDGFKGVFDGNGKRIKGFLAKPTITNFGFFGQNVSGTIKNLIFDKGYITPGNDRMGVIVNLLTLNGTIQDCSNNVNVDATASNRSYVGGICMSVGAGNLIRCANHGNISGNNWVSGITSSVYSTSAGNCIIRNCYNTGIVSSGSGYRSAGIIGEGNLSSGVTTVESCYNTGLIQVRNSTSGGRGILGDYSYGTILLVNCHALDITSTPDTANPQRWTMQNEATMQSQAFVTLLGSPFLHDSQFRNGGFPFLPNEFFVTPLPTNANLIIGDGHYIWETELKAWDVITHVTSMIVSENGSHGIRFYNDKFWNKNSINQWEKLPVGDAIWAEKSEIETFVSDWIVEPFEGNGTASNPYLIYHPYHLNKMRDNLGANYKLMNNIDLGEAIGLGVNADYMSWNTALDNPSAPLYNLGKGWLPVGSGNSISTGFAGSLDGNNKKIKNILMKNTDYYAGFFGGWLTGIVHDLIFDKGLITSTQQRVGCLAYLVTGGTTLENFSNHVNIVSTTNYVGGICVSFGSGKFKNIANHGNVTGVGGWVGGIAGSLYPSTVGTIIVENCYNTGTVTHNNNYRFGGMFGEVNNSNNPTTLINCYNAGIVRYGTSGNYSFHRGVIGDTSSAGITVTNSFSSLQSSTADNINPARWFMMNETDMQSQVFVDMLNSEGDEFVRNDSYNNGFPSFPFESPQVPDINKAKIVIGDGKSLWTTDKAIGDIGISWASSTLPDVEYNTEWVSRMSGSGSNSNPYLIYTPKDLADYVTIYYGQGSIKIMNHLDLTSAIGLGINDDYTDWDITKDNPLAPCYNDGVGWKPFGGGTSNTFDGNNKIIKGIAIKKPEGGIHDWGASFTWAGSNPVYKNMILGKGLIESHENHSSLKGAWGFNHGAFGQTFTNCATHLTIKANSGTACGFCGTRPNSGVRNSFTNCANHGNITNISNINTDASAGISVTETGTSSGNFVNCYNTGNVEGQISAGIICRSTGNTSINVDINNCYNVGYIWNIYNGNKGYGILETNSISNSGTLSNNFSATENSLTSSSWTMMSLNSMKLPSFTETLGYPFIIDSNNQNNGFPIFDFEVLEVTGNVILGNRSNNTLIDLPYELNDILNIPSTKGSNFLDNPNFAIYNRGRTTPGTVNGWAMCADRWQYQKGRESSSSPYYYRHAMNYSLITNGFSNSGLMIFTNSANNNTSNPDTYITSNPRKMRQEVVNLDRYMSALPPNTKFTLSVRYIEFTYSGGVVLSNIKTATKTKTAYDILVNNNTSPMTGLTEVFDFGVNSAGFFHTIFPNSSIILLAQLTQTDKFEGWCSFNHNDEVIKSQRFFQGYSSNQCFRVYIPVSASRTLPVLLNYLITMHRTPTIASISGVSSPWSASIASTYPDAANINITGSSAPAGGEYIFNVRLQTLDAELLT
jgi:hypothetical protein